MRTLVLGIPLPHVTFDNYSFLSAPSFFDYGRVIVETSALSEAIEQRKDGGAGGTEGGGGGGGAGGGGAGVSESFPAGAATTGCRGPTGSPTASTCSRGTASSALS